MNAKRQAKKLSALYKRFLKENGVTPNSAFGNVLMKWNDYLNEHRDELEGENLNTFRPTHILCDSVEGDQIEGVLCTISASFKSLDYGDHTIKLTQFLEKRHKYEKGHFNWVMTDTFGNIVMASDSRSDNGYEGRIPEKADYALLDNIYLMNMQYCYYGDIPIARSDNYDIRSDLT